MSKKKPFIIRDFDTTVAQVFNTTGVIEDQPAFAEKVIESFDRARSFVEHSPLNEISSYGPAGRQRADVDIVKFKVETDITSKDELRAYRTGVRETIKRWAEKSRLTGLRGWRSNAIKTPTFKRNLKTGVYELRFEAILGRKVTYNQNFYKDDGHPDFQKAHDDLAGLKKHLERALANNVTGFNYKHSRYGAGEIL